MVSKNHVQCDEKFLFDVMNVGGSTISVTLYANKQSVKRYLKDIYDESDPFALTFKDGLKRLYEYHKFKNKDEWVPSWLAE